MQTHFTAHLTTGTGPDGDSAHLAVLADKATSTDHTHPAWTPIGDPLLHIPLGSAAPGEVLGRATELLTQAGWNAPSGWAANPDGHTAPVERSNPAEQWTLQQATDHMRAANPNTAQRALARLGVQAVGRAPGRGGQSLYAPAEVMWAHATRPRPRRTRPVPANDTPGSSSTRA
ncbi:hypothetical protein [Kitasatospora sp. NPDC004272]